MFKKLLNSLSQTGIALKFPDFNDSPEITQSILFFGHVQGVGFRYEVTRIATALNLVGHVKNLSDGSVYALIQGPQNKVNYLIEHMKTLKRAHVERVEIRIHDSIDECNFRLL